MEIAMDELETELNLVGGCVCGAVRYHLTSKPLFTHCCHCTHCQAMSGSAFAVNATIEKHHVVINSGSAISTTADVNGGSRHSIFRCKECLSPLWSQPEGRSLVSLRLGSLDKSDQIKPDAHIYLRSKLDWVRPPEEALCFDEFYDIKEVWPKDSLNRLKAALRENK